VPKVVETELLRQSGPLDADLERPVEVAPTHGSPDLGGKYEAVILPHYYIFEHRDLMFDLAGVAAGWRTRDVRGILAFVRRYGLLRHGAEQLGTGNCREPVSAWRDEAARMYWIMDLYVRLKEAEARDSAAPLRGAIADFAQACEPKPVNDEELMDCASMLLAEVVSGKLEGCTLGIASSVQLDVAPNGPGIFLLSQRPPNLVAAAYGQLAQAMVSRAPMQECPGCGRIFIPESGKQKYHSKSCASTSRWRRWKASQSVD
jgi:hypothetical protein